MHGSLFQIQLLHSLSFFYLESLNDNLILPLLVLYAPFFELHRVMKSPVSLVTNPVLHAGCAKSDVWFAFRTLQQNGSYVEYSRCSDIILCQVRMFSSQSINRSLYLRDNGI